jgi:hypothetical protein
MYSPLTTIPRRIRPWRMKSSRRKTPVIMPAHALELSKLTARSAPSAFFSETLTGGSIWVRQTPPTCRLMLDTISMSRSAAPKSAWARASRAAPRARV